MNRTATGHANTSGCWWFHDVRNIFLADFGLLSMNEVLFKPLYDLSGPPSDDYFHQDNVSCHKAQIISIIRSKNNSEKTRIEHTVGEIKLPKGTVRNGGKEDT